MKTKRMGNRHWALGVRGVVVSTMIVAQVVFAQKPDRTTPPPVGPTPSFSMAQVQHFTLSNGLPVVLLEKHQVPLVQINLVIKAGAVNESAEKTGLASMVSTMLTDGAGSRDALAFADAVDYLVLPSGEPRGHILRQ
jgi:hypothetical protein